MWMAFASPFVVGTQLENNEGPVMRKLCDFASAGNTWRTDSRYRVWIPKPVNVMNSPYKPY
jgi:hypothetical protein